MTQVHIDGMVLSADLAASYKESRDKLQDAYEAQRRDIEAERNQRRAEAMAAHEKRLAAIKREGRRAKRIVWAVCGSLMVADLAFFVWLVEAAP